MSPAHCAPPPAYPQITTDERWYRNGNGDWDQRPCFRFTEADGTWSVADGLFDDQRDEFIRQEAERARRTGDPLPDHHGTDDWEGTDA